MSLKEIQMFNDDLIERILDHIEDYESKLLIWGIVDVYQTQSEIENIIYNVVNKWDLNELNDHELDISGLLEELQKRQLIFKINEDNDVFFRSRMSETVRLLYHLRQMFPKHGVRDGWQNAPTLVSDYRFIRRPRFYPKRNLPSVEVINSLQNILQQGVLLDCVGNFINSIPNFKLAKFQMESTRSIFKSLQSSYSSSSGVLISAGTGSGKTLGFYIGALCKIASNIVDQSSDFSWTQCLAIYPRIELLKDQFGEIYKEARKLDQFLLNKSCRKIIIAPLFGDIPKSSYSFKNKEFSPPWMEKGNGYLCPFIKCPEEGCNGDLLWLKEDIDVDKEKLKCQKCENSLDNTEIIFTRETMRKTPPDILFTTTEMLNQNLSEAKFRRLFGIVKTRFKPQMILLDEVHTYNSVHGAQVAFLIRRLKQLIKAKITFVGLSATLVDGARFFSRLIDIPEYRINFISPKTNDLEMKGAEYLIALKGDPVSKSALLSTTIQSNMLISRMIDNQHNPKSNGFYGQKVFAFTDDMDVTNRLYHSILDAEGRNDFGNEVAGKATLASLRMPDHASSRNKAGQNWEIPETIQGNLHNKKRISRVSSQDPGLDKEVDVVVATSSLEVGVDDPNVGAVIQHKSPRNIASFLQRKGRGGRSKFMRPWTTVVLSDYGRDRLSYQSYDLLFNPELKIQPIPIESSYIQHIQGVYSLFDYLASKLFGQNDRLNYDNHDTDIWRDLSMPANEEKRMHRQEKIKNCLNQIISDEEEFEQFKLHLSKSLSINSDQLDAVLWEHPRPLLTTVIPSAIRRLETNWGLNINSEQDYIENSPLPEFIPSTLFGELNLPEIELILPPQKKDTEEETNEDIKKRSKTMPILQALNAFAPGKVSRRFGNEMSSHRHWFFPYEVNSNIIDLSTQTTNEYLGVWNYFEDGNLKRIPVYRPRKIILSLPKFNITDTSNAFLKWHTEFNFSEGIKIAIPKNTKITSLVSSIEAFTNGEHVPLEIRRFATHSDAEIKYKNTDPERKKIFFSRDSEQAAVGFNLLADAVKFDINLPFKNLLAQIDIDKDLSKALKTSRYFFLIKEENHIRNIDNPFLREWLGNVYYNMLVVETILSKCSIEDANKKIIQKQTTISFAELLTQLFQSHFIERNDENEDSEYVDDKNIDKLRGEIETKFEDNDVLNDLGNISAVLWSEFDTSSHEWIEEKYVTTFALSVMSALESFCRDIDTENLILDIIPGKIERNFEDQVLIERSFVISENSPGGLGVIENFLKLYSENPRNFFTLTHSMFFPNEAELNDFQLCQMLDELTKSSENGDLITVVHSFRNFENIQKKETDYLEVKKALKKKNFILHHNFLTTMSNRILRPGSSFDTDFLLNEVMHEWKKLEDNLNIEIDSKVISFLQREIKILLMLHS